MNHVIRNTLLFFALVLVAGLAITLVDEGEARLCVWDGGDAASALASDPDNWDTDVAPIAGDNILFDGLNLVNASADDNCQWDLSNNSFGTFTIAAGYSGTITQSSDMYISGYSQAGGTFTGVTTKWVYCDGNFTVSPTITAQVLQLDVTDGTISGNFAGTLNLRSFKAHGDVIIDATGFRFFAMNIEITTGCNLVVNNIYPTSTYSIEVNDPDNWINNGIITGTGTFRTIFSGNFNPGNLNLNCIFSLDTETVEIIKLTGDLLNGKSISIFCGVSTNTCTLDLNGHSLTASSITVGTRGILQCGEGTITTNSLTATAGSIVEETATWVFTNATVTATPGEKFYNVYMNGWCDFTNSVNVTHDLRFINVPTDYQDIDIYLDTVYSQTIPSPYSWGDGNTVGAKYEYKPDVQITISQFYEDIDFSIYAYISTNLPVTYKITGTASDWLSIYEGRVVGMPPEIGNYTFTITATHDSGSVDIVNGYILVGSLSTAEYSFDMIWELIIWIIITLFMLLGWYMEIPLIQLVAFAVGVGNIINTLRIDNFTALSLIFILGNSILFLMGTIRYNQGRR